jgi:hypothetical protein
VKAGGGSGVDKTRIVPLVGQRAGAGHNASKDAAQDKLSIEPTLLQVRPTRVDHYSLVLTLTAPWRFDVYIKPKLNQEIHYL